MVRANAMAPARERAVGMVAAPQPAGGTPGGTPPPMQWDFGATPMSQSILAQAEAEAEGAGGARPGGHAFVADAALDGYEPAVEA